MPPFIKGLKLSELFFNEAVQPILSTHFPQLELSAGRLDFGSEVLGFDTPMSRDHHWGPRVMLFLRKEDLALAASILAGAKTASRKWIKHEIVQPRSYSETDRRRRAVLEKRHCLHGSFDVVESDFATFGIP